MNVIHNPTVYLVGQPYVTAGGDLNFERFLADQDIEWDRDVCCDTDEIPEIAGRLCFDNKTELLTKLGWRNIAVVDESDSIATLNRETLEFEFQHVDAIHSYIFDGLLYEVDLRDLSFAVTPEHRQYASPMRKNGMVSFGFHETEKLYGRRFRVLTAPIGWTGEIPEQICIGSVKCQQRKSNQFGSYGVLVATRRGRTLTRPAQIIALAKLMAHYAANGSISKRKNSGSGIVIYGRECQEIRRLSRVLGLPSSVWVDKRNGCARTMIGGGLPIANAFGDWCGRGFKFKTLPEWVLNLPSKHLADIWDILVRTDGHRYENGREIFISGSELLAGQTQEILAKIGFSSRICKTKGSRSDCWLVSKKSGKPAMVNKSRMRTVPYNGLVYCPTTRNGVVYVRRNGVVHFSGNCYMSYATPRPGGNAAYLQHIREAGHGSVLEHTVFNFIFVGVSRSLTHELVRHRAGWAFSEISQRYVDMADADAICPDAIVQAGLADIWQDAVNHTRTAYDRLVAGLMEKAPADLPKTDRRKFARQAARSVLPECTETKIFATANVRAIRHFLELRGSRHADVEIRKLALAILKIMREYAPNLFSDYTTIPLPDGTEEINTQFRKV